MEMVRRVFPAALLPALLALGSCTFFAFSLFPGFLSQTEASVDLSARIEAFIDGRSNPLRGELFVLRGGTGTESPCLLLHLDYASDRTLFVFDSDLNLLKQHSYTSLDWLHLLDAKGDFVIGRLNFDDTTWNYLNGYYGSIDGNDVWRPGFPTASAISFFMRIGPQSSVIENTTIPGIRIPFPLRPPWALTITSCRASSTILCA